MANAIKRNIPNAVTCLNLMSGCIGVVFAFRGQFDYAALCILASGLFDLMDGLIARALGVSSAIGKELDSLADVISFGLLPGVIYFQLLAQQLPEGSLLPYAGFIITVFSALRLAKFNIDQRQQQDFIGLNTPMNAFYVLSLPFIVQSDLIPVIGELILHPGFLLGSIFLTSWLLVSNFRLFSMKLSNLSWQDNKYKYLFLLLALALLTGLQFIAFPLILLGYFVFSYLHFRNH